MLSRFTALLSTRKLAKDREARRFASGYYAGSVGSIPNRDLCAVLSYMPSCNADRYCNLGDEFQSIAAAQFLPRVDAFVPRDALDQVYPVRLARLVQRIRVIMAARFYGPLTAWPPPPHVAPIFVGMRLEPGFKTHRRVLSQPQTVRYLCEHDPIGCRDQETCDFLEALGVKTVLTGCITLTLRRDAFADGQRRRDGDVLLIDVPDSAQRVIPSEIRRAGRHLSQILPTDAPQTQVHRTEEATQRLRALAAARLVITTKVHAALASRALGTPVVLLDTGGDTSSRISGMRSFLHCLQIRDDGAAPAVPRDFDWLDPDPAPASSELSTLVGRSLEILARHHLEK